MEKAKCHSKHKEVVRFLSLGKLINSFDTEFRTKSITADLPNYAIDFSKQTLTKILKGCMSPVSHGTPWSSAAQFVSVEVTHMVALTLLGSSGLPFCLLPP